MLGSPRPVTDDPRRPKEEKKPTTENATRKSSNRKKEEDSLGFQRISLPVHITSFPVTSRNENVSISLRRGRRDSRRDVFERRKDEGTE